MNAQIFDFCIKVPRILALALMGIGLIMMGRAIWPDVKEAWIKAKQDHEADEN